MAVLHAHVVPTLTILTETSSQQNAASLLTQQNACRHALSNRETSRNLVEESWTFSQMVPRALQVSG